MVYISFMQILHGTALDNLANNTLQEKLPSRSSQIYRT